MQKIVRNVESLEEILSENRAKNILLVTGLTSYVKSGINDRVEPLLKKYRVSHFQAKPNPKLSEIKKIVQLCREQDVDTILAIGGGSAIDTAKAAVILLPKVEPIETVIKSNFVDKDPTTFFIAVPTTAGSGAESTHFSVVYIGKQKYSLAHPEALANSVILDPSLTYALPQHVTATTGMDALAQAIESYWSIKSTDRSRAYSRDALEKIINNLERSVHKPTHESRRAMLEGANLAGQAINITQTTGPHALSYGFTASYGLDHGEAVGLTLPLFMLFNSRITEKNCQDPRGTTFVKDRIKEVTELLGSPNIISASQKIESLASAIGLRRKLRASDARKTIELLTQSIGKDRLRNNPRFLASSDVKAILEKVIEQET